MKVNLDTVKIRGEEVLIHSGFLAQYLSIQKEIEENLEKDELGGYQLFITGHSLGGALAIIATKYLANDGAGACYTFGSPPVGTSDFDNDIKTPIYRIINYVDIVPRLPNGAMIFVIRRLLKLVEVALSTFCAAFARIKKWKRYKKLKKYLADAEKYRQSGYGSYLVGKGLDVELRYTVGTLDRFRWWIIQLRGFWTKDFEMLSDHSIDEYSRKLADWATNRQSDVIDAKDSSKALKKIDAS